MEADQEQPKYTPQRQTSFGGGNEGDFEFEVQPPNPVPFNSDRPNSEGILKINIEDLDPSERKRSTSQIAYTTQTKKARPYAVSFED